MNRTERITYMERRLDEAAEAVSALEAALDRYAAVRAGLRELTAYYEGGQWMEDFEADAAGEIPRDLKRGVLSEDAVYDLLTDHDRVVRRLRELGRGD